MSFFIEIAQAQDAPAPAPQEPGFGAFLPLIILFALLWFMLIRPQQKRQKEHRQMVEALAKGDEVATNGGLLGRINRLDENFVTLEVAQGVEVNVQRHAVASLMPKGTLKSETESGAKGKAKKEKN